VVRAAAGWKNLGAASFTIFVKGAVFCEPS